jgi:hypothetical protein
MKTRIALMMVSFALTALLSNDGGAFMAKSGGNAAHDSRRIKFRIIAVEEKGAERHIISETVIEGPPGTDFNINLSDERFKMKARFLTALLQRETLQVRAKLDTRRLYGYSESNLPLYEEDEQSQALRLGFDEALVLLPFGSGGGDHRLKIEITPTVSEQATMLPSGKKRPLEINILKPSLGGIMSIEASKIPHNFVIEAKLLEDGREVAGGASPFLIGESHEIYLQSTDGAESEIAVNPLIVGLTIENYTRSRPEDYVAFSFNLSRMNSSPRNQREVVLPIGSGVAALGSEMTLDLNPYLEKKAKRYELKLKIKLAPGEDAD